MDLQSIPNMEGRAGKLAKVAALLCFIAASIFLLLSHSAVRARADIPAIGASQIAYFGR